MSVTLSEALAFALTMAVGQFSPGPDLLLILRNSISLSRLAALSTVLGTTLGIVIHTTVVITGLAVFTERFPILLQTLGLVGACYLSWLGIRMLKAGLRCPKDDSSMNGASASSHNDCRKGFIQGFLTNLTNPKVFLFFTGMLATALPPDAPHEKRILFGAILITEALVLWSLFVFVLQWRPVARLYAQSIRWINGIFGILLLWIAATVFWTQIQLVLT